MGMPYGLLALLAGVALAALLGGLGRSVGLALALGGMATLAVSAASIRRWKAGGDSRFPHTVALLGVAAGGGLRARARRGVGVGGDERPVRRLLHVQPARRGQPPPNGLALIGLGWEGPACGNPSFFSDRLILLA